MHLMSGIQRSSSEHLYAQTVKISYSYTILMWILEEFWSKKYIFFIKDELHSSNPCWVILRSLHLFDYDKHILWLLQLPYFRE